MELQPGLPYLRKRAEWCVLAAHGDRAYKPSTWEAPDSGGQGQPGLHDETALGKIILAAFDVLSFQ